MSNRRRISDEVYYKLVDLAGHTCTYCRRELIEEDDDEWEDSNIEIDHIVPLKQGGADHPDNMQAICGRCNAAKSTKTDSEFREWIRINPEFLEELDEEDDLFD